MTPNFIEALAELVKLLPQIRELCTRQPAIQEAIVTQDKDPTGFRRIKVSRESQGGQCESDWIPCGRSTSFTDEPIPPPGTHCLVALVGGDPHKPFFLRTLSNRTNPPDPGQTQPTKDLTTRVPGNDRACIEGDRLIQVQGERSEEVEGDCYLTVKGKKYHVSAEFGEVLVEALAPGVGSIRLESDFFSRLSSKDFTEILGDRLVKIQSDTAVLIAQGSTQGAASMQLANGTWAVSTANGQYLEIGGGSNNRRCRWDLSGSSVEVVNCTGFTINGREVVVVGSTDSSGDTNNTRGY